MRDFKTMQPWIHLGVAEKHELNYEEHRKVLGGSRKMWTGRHKFLVIRGPDNGAIFTKYLPNIQNLSEEFLLLVR